MRSYEKDDTANYVYEKTEELIPLGEIKVPKELNLHSLLKRIENLENEMKAQKLFSYCKIIGITILFTILFILNFI